MDLSASIGRVTFSKTGKSLYYKGRHFAKHSGFKSNYYEIATGEEYWISGCRKDGADPLYSNKVEIDDDILEDYWLEIRNKPEMIKSTTPKLDSKYSI